MEEIKRIRVPQSLLRQLKNNFIIFKFIPELFFNVEEIEKKFVGNNRCY